MSNSKKGGGYLFPEVEKKSPKSRDWSGKVTFKDKAWYVSAWVKQNNSGSDSFSLLFVSVEDAKEKKRIEGPNPNVGEMFVNIKKLDIHPDFSGVCVLDGEEIDIAAWKKEKDGKDMLSLSVNEKWVPSAKAPKESDESKEKDSGSKSGGVDDFDESFGDVFAGM